MRARRKDVLRDLLHRTGNERPDDGRFPSLLQAAGELSAREAAWSPAAGVPSAWSLVREAMHRLRTVQWAWDHDGAHPDGVPGGAPEPPPAPDGAQEDAWRADLETLDKLTAGAQVRLAAADDRLLDREVEGLHASVALSALELGAFDAYLAGQVALLARLARGA